MGGNYQVHFVKKIAAKAINACLWRMNVHITQVGYQMDLAVIIQNSLCSRKFYVPNTQNNLLYTER